MATSAVDTIMPEDPRSRRGLGSFGMQSASPVDPFEAIRMTADPALSDERDTTTPIGPDPLEAFYEDIDVPGAGPQLPEEQQAVITALYGADFPLLDPNPTPEKWAAWAVNLWTKLAPGVIKRMHLNERNRLFRGGMQWVSSSGFGPWREPVKPRDAARVVRNMVAPALAQRVQLITEQRPGFRVKPASNDPDDKKKAEAKQIALEYQYDQQGMAEIIKEAAYWSGTDGVCFLETYWDPNAGPWHEQYGNVTYNDNGAAQPLKGPMGEVKCRVRRFEQVRVSPNATMTNRPWYWAIREVMSRQEAVRLYGEDVANEPSGEYSRSYDMQNMPMVKSGMLLPMIEELLIDQDKIDRITVYVEKSAGLPKGLTLVIVGGKLVFQGPLLIGTSPIAVWRDGSPDPAFYPQPEMDLWIDSQMRINAIVSKWVENIRLNSGPKLLAKENAISTETLVSAIMSVIGVKGLGSVGDIVRPLESFSIGNDAKEMLAQEIKAFEDLTGWNDVSRGQMAGESGRAILAIREQLERVFAPMINAAARAMTEWGKITCAWMAWGYDYPRWIGVEGKLRPDLAKAMQSEDFDGVTDIFIDPETLMPMPRTLKQFLLKDSFQMGLLSPQEYRRRLPFTYINQMGTPDEDHEARAKRVAEAIRQTANPQALPLLWQDNEAIHQDVLERELILPDDTNPQVRQAAIARWTMLAQQSQMKMGVMPPASPRGGGSSGGARSSGGGLSAAEQPFQGTNPSVASSTSNQIGQPDAQQMAQQFDAQQRRMEQQ